MIHARPAAHRTFTVALPMAPARPTVTFSPRCAGCEKLLAHYLAHPYSLECPRCGHTNQAGALTAPTPPPP